MFGGYADITCKNIEEAEKVCKIYHTMMFQEKPLTCKVITEDKKRKDKKKKVEKQSAEEIPKTK